MLKYGLIPEFIGRVPIIITLEQLDENALMDILTKPKNALARQYKRLFEMDGVELNFDEDALREVAHMAIERKPAHADCAPYWKRHDGHNVRRTLDAGCKSCEITKGVIDGTSAPVYGRGKALLPEENAVS